jgi:hypothetical protein
VLVERVDTEAGEKEADKEQGCSYADLEYGIEHDEDQETAEDDDT